MAGSAQLAQTEQEKLQTLAAGADQRPELVLLVEGSWAGEADTIGLKEAAFEVRMAEMEPSRELFESMFLETQPREALDALLAENTATDEATGEPVLDETAYYRDLRAKLIEAQPVDAAEVEALAGARAETIREFLVNVSGIDPSRVQVLEPVPVEPSGERWVRCRLDVAAGRSE